MHFSTMLIGLCSFSDAKEDRRNASKLYNPFVLEKMTWGTSLNGHPPSWVDYVNRLVVGHDIPSNEVRVDMLMENISYQY